MKNLKYILILITFLLFNIESFAQLPLQFGDGVITHNPNGPVLRVIHTSNTTTAPLGSNWISPPKPANNFYPNWTSSKLGRVFGITLDQNSNPNIYVSSTQVHGGGPNFKRKVWRIDGTTGADTLVYDFNNPSGIGTATSSRSLGNVKYYKFGAVENIYVSDFNTGEIHRLTGNSTTTSLWANSSSIIPKFGGSSANQNWVPYGIAIRKTSSISKLYYAKLNTTAMSSTFEIWSVDLNAVGDFIVGTETLQVLPVVAGNPMTPIADIAFTDDGKKMLIGQQTWGSLSSSLGAHNSMVIELENIPLNSNIWVNSGNNFPSGSIGAKNCVGGVSYSNNVLLKDKEFDCDKSVYFTTDAIQLTSLPFVYGVQGMYSTGGSLANSIWIDADDVYTSQDKTQLGDVEIYKKPNVCTPPCDCGQWENIALSSNANWWNPSSSPIPPTLTFNQGSSTGILFPHYICNGNCSATYSYSLTSASGNVTNLSGTNSLDLSQQAIKNLPCGSYFINITPKCGNVVCPPIRIPLVIVCPPPCSDCGGIASVTSNGTPTISNGTISGNFTINNSKPVSEVRVLVEEFRVTSNNENCLICKNPPKTWGSIQSATLGALSPALSNAITTDNREVVFNNNSVFPMPSNMAITLALPQSVNLSCCEVKVEVCLKFIIRDVNCCEKEILKCFTFTLPQSGTSTGGTTGNYPNMDSTGKCLPGFKDCDGVLANGCEVNITNNSSNCGVCGNVCPSGKTCVGGICL